jgi:hypothetical protein
MPPFLDFQTVAIPFGKGMADDIAESLVPGGKAVVAEQALIDKQGAIQHRPGFRQHARDILGTTDETSDISRVIAHERETLIVDGLRMRAWSPEAGAWTDIDHCYEATVAERYRGERGRDTLAVDAEVCYCNGWVFYAWSLDGGRAGLGVRAVDAATWTKTFYWEIASVTDRFRLLVIGTEVHLVHVNGANGIEAVTWDSTDLEVAYALTTLAAVPLAPYFFNACVDGDRLYLAYWHDDGGNHEIVAESFTSALVSIASVVGPAEVRAPMGIAAVQGGQVFVAWQEQPPIVSDTMVRCAVITEATMVAVGVADVHHGYPDDFVRAIEVVADGAGNACVVWDSYATVPGRVPQLRARWVDDVAALGQGCQVYRIGMLTRPIYRDGLVYVGAYCHGSTHLKGSNVDDDQNRFGYLLQLRFDDVVVVEPDEEPQPEDM